jgi:enoyl-CoA hydratase/carnithine racemase
MTDLVLSDQTGPVRILTLNRPERLNAINPGLVTAFRLALEDANTDENTRVIVLQGAGRAFCTGNDLKDSAENFDADYDAKQADAHARELQEITRQLVSSDKIVIGAINGWAVGAGFEWAINCDFTVWAEDAKAFFPEISWGLFATGGVMTLLSRMVGIVRAREMLLLGEKYDAQALLDLGVAWRIVPESMVKETALEAAERIASLPTKAVRLFKKTFNQAIFMDLEETLEAEIEALVASVMDSETADRVSSFEKKYSRSRG